MPKVNFFSWPFFFVLFINLFFSYTKTLSFTQLFLLFFCALFFFGGGAFFLLFIWNNSISDFLILTLWFILFPYNMFAFIYFGSLSFLFVSFFFYCKCSLLLFIVCSFYLHVLPLLRHDPGHFYSQVTEEERKKRKIFRKNLNMKVRSRVPNERKKERKKERWTMESRKEKAINTKQP